MLLRLVAFELKMDKDTMQRTNTYVFIVNATLTGYTVFT